MQDYDFKESQEGLSTNTSSKSVSNTLQPSRRVLQNIQNYARHANCVQHVNVKEVKIKICLN
jgi:hypothetical protein